MLSVIEIVPEAYKRELAVLQQGVPPKPLHEVTAMIEAGLGKKVHEVFAWLDATPIGSASIGQVHSPKPALCPQPNPNPDVDPNPNP